MIWSIIISLALIQIGIILMHGIVTDCRFGESGVWGVSAWIGQYQNVHNIKIWNLHPLSYAVGVMKRMFETASLHILWASCILITIQVMT